MRKRIIFLALAAVLTGGCRTTYNIYCLPSERTEAAGVAKGYTPIPDRWTNSFNPGTGKGRACHQGEAR